jgi:hypothetical protein
MNFRRCNVPVEVGLVVLIALSGMATGEDSGPNAHLPSVETIVRGFVAANAQRAQLLRGYYCKRIYHLDYKGLFGSHDAEMQVETIYTAPDKKEFKILSESGSRLLLSRVLLRLLSSEQEAQQEQNRKALEITPENYSFSLDQLEHTSKGDFYVLNVIPKGKSRYLYHGKIWVDAKDLAIVRMSGEPQKNPSMWVSHTEIEYRWAKQGGFWLPVSNQSVTQVRMGGKATLNIDYSDYQIMGISRADNANPALQYQSLPDPGSVAADPH